MLTFDHFPVDESRLTSSVSTWLELYTLNASRRNPLRGSTDSAQTVFAG